MGERRRLRGRMAVGAAVLAIVGCVGPAAISVNESPRPTVQPTARSTPGEPAPTASASVAQAATAPQPPGPVPVGGAIPAVEPRLGEWRDGNGLAGFDVSRYQETVDWEGLAESGHAFVYVKATEGTQMRSPTHDDQRADARGVGLTQGAYHYARPAQSSGTLQARFFHSHGGAWVADGRTLPGALDLEFAETGPQCHGLSTTEMTQWVRDFSNEYRRLAGRIPVIYTKAEVWDACTGGDTSFGDHPLWLFDHADRPGTLPSGWERPVLWQRAVVANLDRNVFFGTTEQLASWASAPLR